MNTLWLRIVLVTAFYMSVTVEGKIVLSDSKTWLTEKLGSKSASNFELDHAIFENYGSINPGLLFQR